MKLWVSTSMANVAKEDSGLNVIVYISQKPSNRKGFARVKVNVDTKNRFDENNTFEVLFNPDIPAKVKKGALHSLNPKQIADVLRWVDENSSILLDYWYKRNNNTRDVLNKLKKLSVQEA